MQIAEKKETGKARLSIQEIECQQQRIPDWKRLGNKIEREFRFKDFTHAMRFVNQVAGAAQKLDHHPDIYISYDKVKIDISTHKIGGLSLLDFRLAEQVDGLA